MQLPTGIAIGDLISFANKSLEHEEGLMRCFTFAGAEFFERMKEKALYTIDVDEIRTRVRRYDLEGIYDEKLL